MDGKNFARLSDEKFDLVMNDSTFPGSSGSSALYTVDHFRACRRRLDDGGLFSCWVPLDLRPGELRMILASFQRVFPHCSLWVASNCVNKHALILGSLERMRISFARVRAAMSRPDVAADLKAVAIHDVYDLLDCHVCDAEAIRRMTRDDPPNTDDRPRLEFSCALPRPGMGALWRVLAMLVGHRRPVTPHVANFADPAADRAELGRRFRATRHVFQAQIAQIVGDPPVRRRQFQLALAAHPAEAHVMSCEAELRQEIEDLIAAVARPPHSDRLVLRLADKLYVASRYAEAAPLYEKLAEAARPAAPAVLIHLAEIRHRIGYPEEAERLLRRCLSIWPDSADAHDRLAGICLRTGRRDQARRHLTEAIRLDPTNNVYRAHLKALDAAGRAKTPAPPP